MNILTNNYLNQSYVNITPIKINYNDTTNASRLFVILQKDNLISECLFTYTLRNEQNKILGMNSVIMNGTDYTNWDSTITAAFTFVATKANITII